MVANLIKFRNTRRGSRTPGLPIISGGGDLKRVPMYTLRRGGQTGARTRKEVGIVYRTRSKACRHSFNSWITQAEPMINQTLRCAT